MQSSIGCIEIDFDEEDADEGMIKTHLVDTVEKTDEAMAVEAWFEELPHHLIINGFS